MSALAQTHFEVPDVAGAMPPAVAALREQLESLRGLIATLPGDVYRSAPSRVSGSVGAQVRHCLDHAKTVISAGKASVMSYDSRRRGTDVEIDPQTAIEELDSLCVALEELSPAALDRPVRLDSLTRRSTQPVGLFTTIGREVVFVTQHTIHHAAIIRLLLERTGVATRDDFGYAPSTPLVRA